jgi:hypothetical protein
MTGAARVDGLACRVGDEPPIVGAQEVDTAGAASAASGGIDEGALDLCADAIRRVIRRVADEGLLEVVVPDRFEAEGWEHEEFLL